MVTISPEPMDSQPDPALNWSDLFGIDPDWSCLHEWLARPESDTRECLICGEEANG